MTRPSWGAGVKSSPTSSPMTRFSIFSTSDTIGLRSRTRGTTACFRLNAESCLVSRLARSPGRLDLLNVCRDLRVVLHVLQHQFAVADDDREKVVEVVRDAAGQPSDGFHLLRLPELLFELLPLGDVPRDAAGTYDTPLVVAGPRGAEDDMAQRAIRPQQPEFLPELRRLPIDKRGVLPLDARLVVRMDRTHPETRVAIVRVRGISPDLLDRRTDVHDARRVVPEEPEHVLALFGKPRKAELEFPSRAFGPGLASLRLSVIHHAPYRRTETLQAVLEEIVGSAGLQAPNRLFFIDRAGDDDHRHIALLPACVSER